MLSFPALLLLVAIGVLGVYLALPRGPESEHRAVRLVGLAVGLIGVIFLAWATAGRLPEHGASRLARWRSAVVFAVLAIASVVSAGAAVTARSAMWSIAGSSALLLATAGLLVFLGSLQAAWFAAGLAAATGAAAAVMFRRERRTAAPVLGNGLESGPREVCREPLLACVAGAFLATGLVTVVQAAVADELPRTVGVETNQHPPSQRHRAIPRRSAIERAAASAAPMSETSEAAAPTFRGSDVRLVSRALLLATLLLATGTIGVLSRRRAVAVAVSWAVMLQAIAVVGGAFAALHGGADRAGLVWLPLALLAVEGGILLLALAAQRSRHQIERGE